MNEPARKMKFQLESLLDTFREVERGTHDLVEKFRKPLPWETAKKLIAFRRLRERTLGHDLFADPAWDMLLDLYVARSEGKRISVSSCCIGSNVPQTTALRWMALLERKGLITRHLDHLDHRRNYVELSDEINETLTLLISYLDLASPNQLVER